MSVQASDLHESLLIVQINIVEETKVNDNLEINIIRWNEFLFVTIESYERG